MYDQLLRITGFQMVVEEFGCPFGVFVCIKYKHTVMYYDCDCETDSGCMAMTMNVCLYVLCLVLSGYFLHIFLNQHENIEDNLGPKDEQVVNLPYFCLNGKSLLTHNFPKISQIEHTIHTMVMTFSVYWKRTLTHES